MNRWDLVQELFEATLDLPPADRARVLRERANGDEQLVQRVEALVTASAEPLEAFDRGAGDLLQQLRDEPPADDLCGATFGAYRIDEHLSTGGMAHVYRATRTSAGTERRVALKVLRHGLDTQALLARFQRERETLAALEHENVVSFLDAGALPDGRPFLVMEYIEGESLTSWARRVPVRARLELFLQVLGTIQYAHQRLLVHRDLKPSNVLVTAQGAPKLLDFGIATLTEAGAEGAGEPGPMTPVYASPEQLRGDPITAASDLFALGVVLHEMVTDELPTFGPEALETRTRGDLDLIVRKALTLEPALRYRSADQFASDVRSYLAQEPIAARTGTWSYRAALFARRNRWPLAVGAALVLALIAGWVGSDLERRSAEREAGIGWGAHSQAKVVARVFEDWIARAAAADPALGDAAALHLERALREDLSDLPEAETLVRITLAQLYLDRDQDGRAAEHVDRAWELAQSTRGVGDRDRTRASHLREQIAARLEAGRTEPE